MKQDEEFFNNPLISQKTCSLGILFYLPHLQVVVYQILAEHKDTFILFLNDALNIKKKQKNVHLFYFLTLTYSTYIGNYS